MCRSEHLSSHTSGAVTLSEARLQYWSIHIIKGLGFRPYSMKDRVSIVERSNLREEMYSLFFQSSLIGLMNSSLIN